MKDLKILFFEAKFFMCPVIWLSVNPSSNLVKSIDPIRIDLGTVASMRESRLWKPQSWAILVCSSKVAELWRRGKVSLGLSESTDMDLIWELRENPFGIEALVWNSEREFAGIEGARDEKYLEVETEYVKTGEGEQEEEEEEEGRGCFDSDTSRRRNAWLASRRARSMNQK